ncbi:MAG: ACT domain-containing protein [Methylococcaceae bacterium]
MQLVFNVIGKKEHTLITEIFQLVSDCLCQVVDCKINGLENLYAAYFLISGDWNHIAKLENTLETFQKRSDLVIIKTRPETQKVVTELIPYAIETISGSQVNSMSSTISFLVERNIVIEEVACSRYTPSFVKSLVHSTRYIIAVPADLRLISLREDFLDFCDQHNIDAILEPIKR